MPETSAEPSRSGLVYRLPENQTIKIIGLGGIGSIVVQFLSLFLDSSFGQPTRLVLIDGDEFSPANSARPTCSVPPGSMTKGLLFPPATLESMIKVAPSATVMALFIAWVSPEKISVPAFTSVGPE